MPHHLRECARGYLRYVSIRTAFSARLCSTANGIIKEMGDVEVREFLSSLGVQPAVGVKIREVGLGFARRRREKLRMIAAVQGASRFSLREFLVVGGGVDGIFLDFVSTDGELDAVDGESDGIGGVSDIVSDDSAVVGDEADIVED